MKKEKYKIRTIRMTDKTWEKLKERRWETKLGWEKFIIKLLSNKI